MRILYLGNNWLGWQVLAWLRQQGEELVGLALHPKSKRKFGSEIVKAAGLGEAPVFDGSRLREPEVLDTVRRCQADIAISVLFDYILKPEFLALFPNGVVNLHPSYLPFNRGQYPNVWSIIEGTPAGVTLHYIDEQIDTGDIIAQQAVPVEPADTGLTLYRKLERAGLDLFQKTWPLLRAGRIDGQSQKGTGTYHTTRDVDHIDRVDLDKTYTARDLINILRARTFPPYRGAYFEKDGKRVYLRLELWESEEVA